MDDINYNLHWRPWGSKKQTNLHKVTWLLSSGAGISTLGFSFFSLKNMAKESLVAILAPLLPPQNKHINTIKDTFKYLP